jgi:hypothetical protein
VFGSGGHLQRVESSVDRVARRRSVTGGVAGHVIGRSVEVDFGLGGLTEPAVAPSDLDMSLYGLSLACRPVDIVSGPIDLGLTRLARGNYKPDELVVLAPVPSGRDAEAEMVVLVGAKEKVWGIPDSQDPP